MPRIRLVPALAAILDLNGVAVADFLEDFPPAGLGDMAHGLLWHSFRGSFDALRPYGIWVSRSGNVLVASFAFDGTRIAETAASGTVEVPGTLPISVGAGLVGMPVRDAIDCTLFHRHRGSVRQYAETDRSDKIWLCYDLAPVTIAV